MIHPVLEAHLGEACLCLRSRRPPRHLLDIGQGEGDVVKGVEVRVEVEPLKYHADPAAQLLQAARAVDDVVRVRKITAILERQSACVGHLEQVHHPQQRALAASARAEDHDVFAFAHPDGDALDHVDMSERFVDFVQLEKGARRGRDVGGHARREATRRRRQACVL